MATPLWMPGATRYPASQDGGSMTGNDAYVTWHTFECDYSVSATVGARYLNSSGNQVTLVFHPITGDVIQLIPANRAGRGLLNRPGGVETNRQGRVNIQIEVIGRSSRPWTKDLTAAGRATLRRIIAWLDSLGVPRTAPNGFVGPASYAASTKRARSLKAWNGPGGYFCHADVPENDHWDHGPIDMRDLWAVAADHPNTEEDEVTPDDIQKIAKAVWTYDGLVKGRTVWGELVTGTNRAQAAYDGIRALASTLPADAAKAVLAALDATYDAKVELTPKEN